MIVTSTMQEGLITGIPVNKRPLVLVVDDEQRILTFTAAKLRACGYDVITAANGEDALKLATSDKPDAMVLDIVLPGMSGFEVLRKLRATSSLPVILVSAWGYTGDEAASTGATDYLAKPFDPDELASKVRGCLGQQP